jgi:hypothetical protein
VHGRHQGAHGREEVRVWKSAQQLNSDGFPLLWRRNEKHDGDVKCVVGEQWLARASVIVPTDVLCFLFFSFKINALCTMKDL